MKALIASAILVTSWAPLWAQSAQDAQAQTEERNKALIRRFYDEVWNKGNFDVVDEVFAPTYVPHDSSAIERPGRESAERQKTIAAEVRTGFMDNFSESRLTVDFIMAEGDKVAARWTLRGRPKGVVSLFAADQFQSSGANVFRFADGKVVEIWNHRDDWGTREQLGFFKLQMFLSFLAGVGLCGLVWLIPRLRKKLGRAAQREGWL
jgi:predicted ester cyclase